MKFGGKIMKRKLVCVDLFSGLGGFSQAMVDRGWKVIRVDNDPKFKPNICADVRELTATDFPNKVDLLVSSPPCECFSVASISKHWVNYVPDRDTLEAIGLVYYTLFLKDAIRPRFWVLENPRCMLRRIIGLPKVTTYWASWGEPYLKPTDLWGELPPMEWPKPRHWIRAPRGSKDTLQNPSLSRAERAKIPYKLSEALAIAVERTTLDYHFKKTGENTLGG